MAYPKVLLDNRNEFQRAVAIRALVRMLHAADSGLHGATEIASESAAVGGWDDIVEFGHDAQGPYARHWQVKDQNTEFKCKAGADTLRKYFRDAWELVSNPDPFGDSCQLAPRRIEFTLGFPGLDISFRPADVEKGTSFVHLRDLCRACRGSAGPLIA